jgi:PAS domain S-box-containing protein
MSDKLLVMLEYKSERQIDKGELMMKIGKCRHLVIPFVLWVFLICLASPTAASVLSKEENDFLRKKQNIVFVSQTKYPPFEFVENGGDHTGMSIELARWMATEFGFTAEFKDTSFQEAQKAILSGEADVLTSFFYSKKRDELFDFTQVMFEVPASIFVSADRTDIKDLRDLNGKIIAMQKGDYAKEYLEAKRVSFEVMNTKNFADATDLVIAGKADAVIGDEQIVLYHIFKNRLTGKIKKVGEPLYIGKNCMATREGNLILTSILIKGISQAQKTGVLEKINRKWVGTRYSLRESVLFTYLPHILISIGVTFVLVLLVWFWNIKLRHEVGKSTEELKRTEQRYRSLFEQSRDAIYINSTNGDFVDVNQSMLELFGYTKDEMIGMSSVETYVAPDKRAELLDELNKGSVRDYELKLKKKDGKEMDCLVTATVRYGDDGSIIGYEGIIRDVTEKRKLEAQLQRAEKMEAVGALAGGVAHDLNNILTGLVSYPDLLLMQIPEDSPLRKSILTIKKSGINASAVVEDLLTMARRGVPTVEITNLNDVIADYLKSPEFGKLKFMFPNIEVQTDFGKDLLNISGSTVHLSKTVMNLVSNAAESMPGGGRITLSTKNQYIDTPIKGYDEVIEGDYATLTVSDQGIGISAEDMERIFEPFYTKKKMGRSGSGLGMAVVWGTIKDHDGYINIESTEGEGTSFTLYFPASRKKAAKEAPELPLGDYMGRGESVLVVDDVAEQRGIASDILSELGYSVATVSSGEEAIEYMKNNSVDLMVLDMIMEPGIDGLDTYKAILEIRPNQKAVIASGFSETDRVRAAQRLGAGPYIRKPYTLEKMAQTVREELDRHTS